MYQKPSQWDKTLKKWRNVSGQLDISANRSDVLKMGNADKMSKST